MADSLFLASKSSIRPLRPKQISIVVVPIRLVQVHVVCSWTLIVFALSWTLDSTRTAWSPHYLFI